MYWYCEEGPINQHYKTTLFLCFFFVFSNFLFLRLSSTIKTLETCYHWSSWSSGHDSEEWDNKRVMGDRKWERRSRRESKNETVGEIKVKGNWEKDEVKRVKKKMFSNITIRLKIITYIAIFKKNCKYNQIFQIISMIGVTMFFTDKLCYICKFSKILVYT